MARSETAADIIRVIFWEPLILQIMLDVFSRRFQTLYFITAYAFTVKKFARISTRPQAENRDLIPRFYFGQINYLGVFQRLLG